VTADGDCRLAVVAEEVDGELISEEDVPAPQSGGEVRALPREYESGGALPVLKNEVTTAAIAVAGGAGGHAGTQSAFSLVREIREFWDGTLVLGGAISDGFAVRAALSLGADGMNMGTRFIATRESNADAGYKQMILDARAADIVHTPAVSGVPASFMRQSLEKAGYDLARLQDKGDVNYGEKLKPISDEAKAWKTVWSAGQGVGGIADVPSVAELVARLDAEYRAAQGRSSQLSQHWPR